MHIHVMFTEVLFILSRFYTFLTFNQFNESIYSVTQKQHGMN